MGAHVLAVDLGSTGIKVAVVDPDGVVLAGTGEVLPLLFTVDGGAEQDPEGWWDALGRCSRRAIATAGVNGDEVGLVAVTSQYTSIVAVDDRGLPLGNVIMWMDRRGRRHHTAIADGATAERWREVHGAAPSGYDDLGHIAFIRACWPDVYERARAFVEPMDALAARLTGRVTSTQNTAFPLFSVDNRTWGATTYSDELLGLSGLDPSKLAELVPMGTPRGCITPSAATHLGIATSAIVADATIDSVTSAIGTGAVEGSRCGLIIGTTSVMATHVDSKRHDPAHGLTTAPSPVTDSWFLLAENGMGGKNLDVFVNQFVFADDGLSAPAGDDAFDRVLDLAATSPTGANGVLFLPWLLGSMAPRFDRRVRAGFLNIGLGTTRADLARAVLEGVGLNAAWLLPHFAELAHTCYGELSLGGGGAASPLWGQVVADATGVSVRRLESSRTTNAHGAALLALVQAGRATFADVPSMLRTAEVHHPEPVAEARAARRLQAMTELHQHLGPIHDLLNHHSEAMP